MVRNTLLGITLPNETIAIILEKIKKYLSAQKEFCHIVSLNPENLVIARKSSEFKKVIETAQIKIIDGVGIVLAARTLGMTIGKRISGVNLMKNLIVYAGESSLTVLFLGGRPNLANTLAECYGERFSEAKFIGIEGFKNIHKQTITEKKKIMSIVRQNKPHLIFTAFGSPWQELWLARHKRQFNGMVCMGVGGAFDFLAGRVKRAPTWIQRIGLEWLYRLLRQPWRWRRQVRLIEFIWLVLKEWLSY